MALNTKYLVDQLRDRLVKDAAIAARAGSDARDAAQHSATAAEKREDSRTMIEYSNLAHAQAKRVARAQECVRSLDGFATQRLPNFSQGAPIGIGAIVEAMSEDDDGEYCKTFVLLPVGAGEELTGPAGDGIISVVTPRSPVGRALLGKQVGDVAESVIRGEPIDWEVLEITG